MGCACGRDSVDTETKLVELESLLPYHFLDSKYVIVLHKKLSQGQALITDSTLTSILEKLYGEHPNTSGDFYTHLKTSDGRFDLKILSVLGITLSLGTTADKSQLLFELYEEDKEGEIKKESLAELINTILDLAIEKIPLLSSNLNNHKELSEYVEDLKKNKINLFNYIVKKIEIGNDDFVNIATVQAAFENEENKELLTLTGVRKQGHILAKRKKL